MATKAKKRKSIRIVDTIKEQRLKLPFMLMIANKILDVIGFVDIINQSVEWDPKHWKVSPGNLAKAVILATFMKVRAPLYKIKDVYKEIDTQILFAPECITIDPCIDPVQGQKEHQRLHRLFRIV